MALYNRLRVIIGEEKVVAYVHADALWDICAGDGGDDDDDACSSTFIDVEVWSTSSTEHTNGSLSEGGQCRYHVRDSQGCVWNKVV